MIDVNAMTVFALIISMTIISMLSVLQNGKSVADITKIISPVKRVCKVKDLVIF